MVLPISGTMSAVVCTVVDFAGALKHDQTNDGCRLHDRPLSNALLCHSRPCFDILLRHWFIYSTDLIWCSVNLYRNNLFSATVSQSVVYFDWFCSASSGLCLLNIRVLNTYSSPADCQLYCTCFTNADVVLNIENTSTTIRC